MISIPIRFLDDYPNLEFITKYGILTGPFPELEEIAGFKIIIDNSIPEGEIYIHSNGKIYIFKNIGEKDGQ